MNSNIQVDEFCHLIIYYLALKFIIQNLRHKNVYAKADNNMFEDSQ